MFEMLFLVNIGSVVLCLDVLVFIWKEFGINCENQEKVYVFI